MATRPRNDIDWCHVPPEEAMCPHLALKRVPAKGFLRAIIVSTKIFGCWTHFWGGCTVPCSLTSCPACADGAGRRWHAYLHMFCTETQDDYLLELTAMAVQPIVRVQEEQGTINGIEIRAMRTDNRPNARIRVEVNQSARGKYVLPNPVDVRVAMRNIWRVDSTTRSAKSPGYEATVREMLAQGGPNGEAD